MVAAPVLWLPRTASAADTEIRDIDRGALGTTITLGVRHGPFPFAGKPYRDDTCLVFVPKGFRVHAGHHVDTLVHFHGHGTTAKKTIVEKQLREQVAASEQNVILVVPQGPVDAKDGSGGKLDEDGGLLALLGEIRHAIQRAEVGEALGAAAIPSRARIGTTAISAHSGGYRVAASCLVRGRWNVTETYLFDALYGARDEFRAWIAERRDQHAAHERHKLLAWYSTKPVTANCAKLRAELDDDGIAYRHERDETAVVSARMVKARVAFIHTDNPHREVVHKTDALRDALRWSCFSRIIGR